MVAARGAAEAVTLDLQHGLFDHRTAVHAIRAIAAQGAAPLARLPGIDAALAGYVLDAGAAGVIAPMVESLAEAEALLLACATRLTAVGPMGRRAPRCGPVRTPSLPPSRQ
jgi:4-hydroxy-2-oxoheptanedioate aldolase